ncbi:MAG: DMT family transporter [Gammaproteobacteria bacterium]|nr:DMT family transporter [Gammaproteobacteria bacterium]
MQSITIKNWLTLLLISLIWGSSYYLIKLSLLSFTPTQVGLGRIALSGIALLPLFIHYCKGTSKAIWFWCSVLGLIGFLIPFMCFSIAQTVINSSLAGMLNSLQPLFTLLIGTLFFNHPLLRQQFLGVIIGLTGALILLSAKSSVASYTDNFAFSLLVVLATLCYGIAANIIRVYLQEVRPIKITSLSLGLLIIPSVLVIFFVDGIPVFQYSEQYLISVSALMFLSIVGTSMAVILYNKLLFSGGMMMAASVAYLIPVVAMMWGVFGGEHIHSAHLLGISIIFAGLYLTNKTRAKTYQ